MTAKEHNKLLGIFLLAHGGLQALVMIMLAVIYAGMGTFIAANARNDEGAVIGLVFFAMIAFVVIFSAILIVPQIIGGYKLLKEAPSARTWGIIGSIVSLLNFPLGTAAGVYGLCFLFGDVGKQFYLGGGQRQPQMFNPPPPNSWQ